MGIYDRDWYKEAYKKKEEKYGSDFSGNNTEKKEKQTKHNPFTQKKAEYAQKNTGGPTYTHATIKNIQLGNDIQDKDVMHVLGVCPKCYNLFSVNILKKQLYNYSYSCPICNQSVAVKSKKKRSIGGKIGIFFACIIGIPIVIGIVSVLGHYLYSNAFPQIEKWFLETFGAYL